jgi:outer membrane protein OmpA-like peptidoglycan-associated protein/osmotically-inducible protein OsmY
MLGKGTCWSGFWIGVAVAAFTLIASMFGPHPLSLRGVEAGLKARVESALAARGYRDISVEMDGQTAILSGPATSPDVREGAKAAALTAAGPGGVYLGGVARVEDRTVLGAAVSPFLWAAERTSAGLVLSGYVPDVAARERLLDVARTRFGGAMVTDRMQVALGAPAGDWRQIASDALTQLAKLNRGKARLVDDRLTIVGEGDQAAVAEVRRHYGAPLPAPYTLMVSDLTVEGLPLGIPELANLNLSEASAQTCQTAFAQLLRTNVIEFDSASAAIDPQSKALLDNLAVVARRCDRYAIKVSGHTDNVGDAAANVALSKARADAVRTYLIGQGVAAERLATEGFGQSKPKVPNTRPANRARNRRIEFNVS